jgi:transcriptional regulator with XRE-family HTH domain
MSLISKKSLIQRIRRGKQARAALVEANVAKEIAFQIRATRDKRNWTQERLAREAGMTQNTVSRLEDPDYGKHSVTSLKRIADALDVALVVRLLPFSKYVNQLSGTPYTEQGLDSESLAVSSFQREENDNLIEVEVAQERVQVQRAPLPNLYAGMGMVIDPGTWPGGSTQQKVSENVCVY